jgi:hypothetical protein
MVKKYLNAHVIFYTTMHKYPRTDTHRKQEEYTPRLARKLNSKWPCLTVTQKKHAQSIHVPQILHNYSKQKHQT